MQSMFIAVDRFIVGDIIPVAFEASCKDDYDAIDVDRIDGDRIESNRIESKRIETGIIEWFSTKQTQLFAINYCVYDAETNNEFYFGNKVSKSTISNWICI